jgi:phospholipid transport system substrate-binding protein
VIEPKSRGRCIAFSWLVAVLCVFAPSVLRAGVPTDQVRSTIEEVLKILNNPDLKSASAKEEKRNRLRQAIYPRFDFAEMARRSLGPT